MKTTFERGASMRSRARRTLLATAGAAFATAGGGSAAHAQSTPVVSACAGVSLPPSAVRDILLPVVSGIVDPVQNTVNPLLAGVGGLLGIPALGLDASTIVDQAAAGQPITLDVLDTNGNVVGAGSPCASQADVITLTDPAGIAIGGNQITGLGANGAPAMAGEINSIAFGNGASTSASAAGSIAVGTNAAVGANATGSVALGRAAQATAANSVALGAGSTATRGPQLAYDVLGIDTPQNSAGEVSVGAPGAARQITNVAAGSAPTDAVNVAQLAGVAADLDTFDALSVKYDGVGRQIVTFAGAGGTTLRNVAPGTVSATSTDAVNGAQLFATNQSITTITNNVNNGAVGPLRYSNTGTPTTPNGGTITNDVTLVGGSAGPVAVHNVADGVVATGSTDAVNGGQLSATNNAVTNLTNNVNNGAVGPVRYSNAASPTTPNGGTITNDVTLVGADPGAVAVHNVANGAIAPGSTDAVNGSQVYGLAANAVNAVTYDTDANGVRSNRVTLAGGTAGAPVAIANVAPATLSATSTEAVNGSQLYATNQLATNSIQYDDASHSVATLGGTDAAAPVALRNVGPGTAPTDAVNVAQLNGGLDDAVADANAYTDARLANLDFNLGRVRRNANAGISGALAAAGLPQAYTPGKGMIAIAGGTYGGQGAVALGMSKAMHDGRTVVKASATYNSRKSAGANAGIGWQF